MTVSLQAIAERAVNVDGSGGEEEETKCAGASQARQLMFGGEDEQFFMEMDGESSQVCCQLLVRTPAFRVFCVTCGKKRRVERGGRQDGRGGGDRERRG